MHPACFLHAFYMRVHSTCACILQAHALRLAVRLQLNPGSPAPADAAVLPRVGRRRDALNELPQHIVDDLLTLHEAHAALRHLLCTSPAAPRHSDAGWPDLRRLLAMSREMGCEEEAHFLPLEDFAALRAALDSQQNAVPSLVRLLHWQSPQGHVKQRTRGAYTAGEAEPSDGARKVFI